MILLGLLFVFLSCSQAITEENSEVPFATTSKDDLDAPKVSNLLPELALPPLTTQQQPSVLTSAAGESFSNRGRSDIEIEKEEPTSSGGYVYPKPANPLYLPPFKTLDASLPLDGASSYVQEGTFDEVIRSQRSPQRPTFFYPRPSRPPRPRPLPNYPSGWTYPGIRPLPALYGRPMSLLEGITP